MEEKWVCTDLDSSQYRKINADSTYIFIEKVWLDICEGDEGYPDKEYTVKSVWIDLNDYSDYEKSVPFLVTMNQWMLFMSSMEWIWRI